MTTLSAENQLAQGELFEGYRPLITHNRKRNTITAELPKYPPPWARPERKPPEERTTHDARAQRQPQPAQARVPARRDESAALKEKVEALIECFKPVEFGTKGRDRRWMR